MNDTILSKEISEFKQIVSDFKQVLFSFEKKCFEFDRCNPSGEQQIDFIRLHKNVFFQKLNEYFSQLSSVSKAFDKAEYQESQQCIKKDLLIFFVRYDAPFNRHIYQKPFGYAGDYVAINFIYQDGYTGFSTYGKLVDSYILSLPLSRGHINRRRFFRELISETIVEKSKQETRVNISSFACGSAPEVFDILREKKVSRGINITLIDGEQETVDFLKSNLSIFPFEYFPENVRVVYKNILNLVRKIEKIENFEKQDLIYCAGFLDYLNDKTATRLIKYLFSLLNDDGLLVLVNVSKDNDRSVYMEMMGGWFLSYRDEKEFLSLAQDIKECREKKIICDNKEYKNLYLVIGK